MKLFLIRHAETTANTSTVILGGKEHGELSPRGKLQAAGVARRLAKEKISAIYCSSLFRARQTAEAIAKGRGCTVHFCDELREIEVGKLSGLSHEESEIKFPNAFNNAFESPSKKLPGGECVNEVKFRAMPLIEALVKENNSTIAVIGHNVVNRVILASLLGMPLERARSLKIKNACVVLINPKPGFAQLYSLDNSLHGIR